MKFIKQRLPGTLLVDGERAALRLHDDEAVVYLAFALVTQGIAAQIVPTVLLDDWGTEIKGLGLYDWVRENGMHFPRAEVFGFSPAGESIQYFLRDVELFAAYPVYAAADKASPIADWRPVFSMLVPDSELSSPVAAAAPAALTGPLRQARVGWWRVPPRLDALDFIEARDLPLP
ncbi:MAG TPA: hypothetical protein PK829_04515 [Promineifilum sp.]|nr:hypothetical protein [Promineifilum sp.]